MSPEARFTGGALADDPGRRRVIAIGGYGTTVVLSSLIGVTNAVWQVPVLRSAAWAVRGLPVPARNALLADVVPADAYGRAYGFERAMDTSARSSATLLGIALVAVAGVRSAILLSVIPGLLAVAAIVYAIRAAKLPKVAARQPIHFHVRPVLRAELARLVGAIAAFEFANAAATMLILRAIELLTPGHAPTPPLRSRLLSTPPTTWPRRDQHSRRPFRRPPGTGARAHDGERRVRSRVPDI